MEKILRNGDNTYYYHYNLHTVTVEGMEGVPEEREEFTRIMLRGLPNKKDCVRAVIRYNITLDEEFDLINSYNDPEHNLSDVDKYMDYLKLLKEIKANVTKDFDEYPEYK